MTLFFVELHEVPFHGVSDSWNSTGRRLDGETIKNADVIGFYRDLMGFYSDFMGFYWDVIGNSIEVLYCIGHLSHMPIGLGFDRSFIGI